MTPQVHCPNLMAGSSCYDGWSAASVNELGRRLPERAFHTKNLPSVSFSHKGELTLRKLTACKIASMDDQEWLYLEEPWQRLRWARLHWQRSTGSATTGKAAAEALGFSTPEGYTAYEREPGASKHTPLSPQRAIQFGRKFKINWVWILEGKGTPFDTPASGLSPSQSRIVEMMADKSEEEQETVVRLVEMALKLKAG